MTLCDRVSRLLGRRSRTGDGDPSSSGFDAPRMRETRPFGRRFGASGRRPEALMMLPHHGAPRSLPETPKRRHKGSLLTTVGISGLAAGKLGEGELQTLGRSLGMIIDDAPMSSYQLTSGEFTLRPGKAYFLPGGGNSLAVVGPFGADRPDSIYVRRNGRKVPMSIGSVRIFKIDGRTCTLMLHALAQNYASATFSFGCRDP